MSDTKSTDLGTLAFYSDFDDFDTWRRALRDQLPNLHVVHADEVDNLEDVKYVAIWKPPHGFFAQFPNLKMIVNLGAGVDALVDREDLPPNLPVTKLNDPHMSRMMCGYVLFAVLRHVREIPFFEQAQRLGQWAYRHPRPPHEINVAVLGLGQLGSHAARELQRQGMRVLGWSRRLTDIEGVECFAGLDTLEGVLGQADVVVIMLPLTASTRGIMNRDRLAQMKPGAALVNVARGPLVDESALVELLRSGHIGGATLDVFEQEPLPSGNALWSLPNVLVTPHLASTAIPASAALQIAENISRVSRGETPLNTVDVARGY